MELGRYVDEIHAQLESAAQAGGEEAQALARVLATPLDSAVRLALLDALATAAEEITVELVPGSVELRLHGTEPRFVVTPPPADPSADAPAGDEGEPVDWRGSAAGDEGTVSRINVRMPERMKARVDQAADAEGLSINSWLVRAAAARLERSEGTHRVRRAPHGAQRYTGWAR